MEYISKFIITLVTVIIFINAVEIIAPDNSMKKYIKFILGLILISVMLNPIVYIFTKGESDIIQTITKYESMLSEGGDTEKNVDSMNEEKEAVFKKNLNNNCNALLKEQFKDKEFQSDIQCTFNYDEMTYTIDKVNIKINDKGVKPIEKVNIDIDSTKEVNSTSENYEEIKEYLTETLKVPPEKVDIIDIER